jgi:hypothetical protein
LSLAGNVGCESRIRAGFGAADRLDIAVHRAIAIRRKCDLNVWETPVARPRP